MEKIHEIFAEKKEAKKKHYTLSRNLFKKEVNETLISRNFYANSTKEIYEK